MKKNNQINLYENIHFIFKVKNDKRQPSIKTLIHKNMDAKNQTTLITKENEQNFLFVHLLSKLNELEKHWEFDVSTETVRCWIYDYLLNNNSKILQK